MEIIARSRIQGINGNLVTVATPEVVLQNGLADIITSDGKPLMAEVIKVRGDRTFLQVFDSTRGLRAGDEVHFYDGMLSVKLGPGLLGKIYDGLQNPLEDVAAEHGFFLERGARAPALNNKQKWHFVPTSKVGDNLRAGMAFGHVYEGAFKHLIMVPFGLAGKCKLVDVAPEGKYTIDETVAKINLNGQTIELSMSFDWAVKIPISAFVEKLVPWETLVTQQRILDSMFPLYRGGTACIPGPFGAGKTVLLQCIARHADVDIVIVAACGERAGEIVEILREFPELVDPRTGKPLMNRTIIIANTSSMPVAAREASVYTAVTLGEYYRQMGLNVLVLADSTSRWAQAMREMSGRLEEIPGEEAFPAYMKSLIARFYERAGVVKSRNGQIGSLTICGTVSPAGGNFNEPVTQSTLEVVSGFWGLSKARADSRKFPAIDPLTSWSKASGVIPEDKMEWARSLLSEGKAVSERMSVVGEDGVTTEDYVVLLKAELFDSVYLQQNAFDEVDAACPAQRQTYTFNKLFTLLNKKFAFGTKEEGRKFFNNLRQQFLDWNGAPWETAEFAVQETSIDQLLTA
jgi:V/A-type H+-transporting ATPase subunit A